MGRLIVLLITVFVTLGMVATNAREPAKTKGIIFQHLNWMETEKVLTPDTVVVIPLGGAAKEHGPHLPLDTDWLQAEYYKYEIAKRANVVIAPTIPYSFYPAFLEYPGSVSIDELPARYAIIDECTSLARYGPKRFYVINVGVSTAVPLQHAKAELEEGGILLDWSGYDFPDPELAWAKKAEGTHADEVETSVLLFIAPNVVHMNKAVRDYHQGSGGLTRDPNNQDGTYSRTGTWGDPTRATRQKGKAVVRAEIKQMLKEIEELRHAPLPPKTKE